MNSLIKYPKLNFILILLIFCFTFFFTEFSSKKTKQNISNYGCYMSEKIKKVKISGIVEKKYINKRNHSTPMLLVNNGRDKIKISLSYEKSEYFKGIHEGDSLLKEEGTLKIFTWRHSIMYLDTLNFGCFSYQLD
jgi:hypothetical protein